MFRKPILMGWLLAAVLVLPSGSANLPTAFAQSDGEEGAGMSDLDKQLFNDLGSDLFDDLDLPAEATEAPKEKKPTTTDEKPGEKPPGQPDPSDDDPTGERGFGADPDLGTPQGDPLSKIGGMMREVQKRIAGGQAEQDTVAMQQEIIDEINKLLEQQNQQQQQNQNNNQQQNQQQQNQNQQQQNQQQNQQQQQSQQQSQQQQQGQQQGQQPQNQQAGGSQSQPGQSEMQPGEESKDSENSSDRLREEKVLAISPEEQDALVKKSWGNLPPHLRKQISNSTMERFLPKYERLTQEYFRKLAEVEE